MTTERVSGRYPARGANRQAGSVHGVHTVERNGEGNSSTTAVRAARCVLFAYHDMGYACMRELIDMGAPIAALFTHRDTVGEEVWWRPCDELARDHAIPVFTIEELDHQWTERIVAMQPAVIYSFFYRKLLPEEILKSASIGAFNLHPSLLPKYRGRAPVNWMIINGEQQAGVTLHHMVARADAGDIVAQRRIEIDERDTAITLCRKLVPLGAAVIREYHPMIIAGRAPSRAQNLAEGSYFGRRRPEDGRIEWNWPARRIFNLIRGVTHPYPGAFCFAGQRKLMVWEARVAHDTGARGRCGELIGYRSSGEIEVAAGTGSLFIVRAQFEGDAEADAASVLPNAPSRMQLS